MVNDSIFLLFISAQYLCQHSRAMHFFMFMVQESQVLAMDQLRKRVVFGVGIGIGAGGIIVAGGWVFTIAVAAMVFVASREYFELVRSHGIAYGMIPPPRYVSRVCSVICALMPILTL